MLRTSNILFNGGTNMRQCFLQLDFQLDKFWGLLDPKQKQKTSFLWLEFLLTLGDVICKQKTQKSLFLSTKIDLMILKQDVNLHLYYNSLKGIQTQKRSLKSLNGNLQVMKLLKCKSSINKLMVILQVFPKIPYNIFIIKKNKNYINF